MEAAPPLATELAHENNKLAGPENPDINEDKDKDITVTDETEEDVTSVDVASASPRFKFMGRWRADKDRFEKERDRFDFEKGELPASDGDSAPSESNKSSSSQFTSSREFAVGSSQSFRSNDKEISSKLDIEPSQLLVKQSSAALSSSFAMSNSFSMSNSSFRLDLSSSLAIDDIPVLGREANVQQMYEIYDNPSIPMLNIVGKSGVGKSVLAQQIGHKQANKTKDGKKVKGAVCLGKFDVYNRADPYQAFAEAICGGFLAQIKEDEERLEQVRTAVRDAVGDEGAILTELSVSFAEFLISPDSSSSKRRKRKSFLKVRGKSNRRTGDITFRGSQIQNVFVEFLGAISTADHPLTIILDDIQWAGPAALALIEALLNESNGKLKHLFLLSTCRQEYLQAAEDTEDEGLHHFFERHSERIHQMKIEGLQADAVKAVVDTILGMEDSPETVRLAEIVHQKTHGNPYFVVEFMRALVDDNLLVYERGIERWTWFEDMISSRNVADNVADAVSKRLQKLGKEQLFVTQLASCISRSIEEDTLQFVLSGLRERFENVWTDIAWPRDLHKSMAKLEQKGILESSFGISFVFAHDQLKEAAFQLIPDELKGPLQLAIGKRLIEGIDSFHRDEFLLTAVELCGKGISEMEEEEKKTFAFWALLAGDMALKRGAFHLAMKFLDLCADCMGDHPLDDDPEMALLLYSVAAETAYCISDFDKADKCIGIANSSHESIPVHKMVRLALVKMKVQCGRREFQSAATTFRETIKKLGLGKLSKSPSTFAVLFQAMKTVKLLKAYDQAKLSALPECTDPTVALALNCHSAISASLYVANPNLFIIAACKSMQWSLRHGVSASSPTGFCCTAILLISLQENAKALEVAESALAICDTYNYREALPLTVALVFGFVRHWSRPMRQFMSPMRYAIDVGTRLGCVSDVAVAMNTCGLLMMLTSAQPLGETLTELQGYRQKMREGKQDDQACFTECNLQFAHKLAYAQTDDADSMTLDGEYMTEASMRAIATENNDVILNAFVDYFKMQLCIYFGMPQEAAKHGEKVVAFGFEYGQGTHMVPRCSFMIGLANVLCFKANRRPKNLKVAKAMLNRLRVWAKQKNPNVLHFLQLLRAELAFATAKKKSQAVNYKDAEKNYKMAMVSSKRMGFRLDFALSSELYALFQMETLDDGKERAASYYMTQAHGEYESYGALSKALHLRRTYPALVVA